jgi:hypothetical protein
MFFSVTTSNIEIIPIPCITKFFTESSEMRSLRSLAGYRKNI